MKALSLWCPWPFAICFPESTEPGKPRPKRLENRTGWQEGSPALGAARKLIGSQFLIHAAESYGNRDDFAAACDHIVGILGPTVIPKLVERPRYVGSKPLAWPPAESLARGALVARVVLADVVRTTIDGHRVPASFKNGAGVPCRLCGQRSNARCPEADPWAIPGSVGLLLASVEVFTKPIPCTGRQGWFNVPDAALVGT